MIMKACLRCSMTKDWYHIIQYEGTETIQNEFARKIGNKIKKIKDWEVIEQEIVILLTDIINFIKQKE